MPCFSPLVAWRGFVGDSGKRSVVFKVGQAAPGLSVLPQMLPDGQCIGCRLDYALDWAVRCECEVMMHKRNCFITLTWGPNYRQLSLSLKPWQLFMKRVRKKFGSGVRYFHAGEYGEINSRMHDHALLFGVDFDDRVLLKVTPAGSKIYTSKILSSLWPYGFVSVGDATFESAGYLARYCISKPTLTRRVLDDNGFVVGRTYTDRAVAKYGERVNLKTGELSLFLKPEYLTMSRRPGLGKTWFEKYECDVFPRDYVLVRGSVKMPPPRYFDSLYEEKNPVDMARIKCARMSRCSTKEEVWNEFLQKFQLLDVARDERLKVREEVETAKLKLFSVL